MFASVLRRSHDAARQKLRAALSAMLFSERRTSTSDSFPSMRAAGRCRAEVWQFLIVYSRAPQPARWHKRRMKTNGRSGSGRRGQWHAARPVIRFMFARLVFVLRIACARIDHSRSRRGPYSRVYYINNAGAPALTKLVLVGRPVNFTCRRRRRFSRVYIYMANAACGQR